MDNAKNVASGENAPTYQAQMSALRLQLNGRPYQPAVSKLLPEVSKATIHGAVNGRNENALVLEALKIVVFNLEKEEQDARGRLQEEAKRVGLAA